LDAAPPPEKAQPYSRYRTAVRLAVFVPTAALALLIAASIVIELLDRPLPRAHAPALTPAEITTCRRDVAALLDALVREGAREQEAPRGEALGETWDAFGKAWDAEHRAVSARCRFDELAESGLGREYDRAAWVHQSLPRTRLKIGHQLARFARDLADEIAGMRRALEDKTHE
jgi:hypothetical protein